MNRNICNDLGFLIFCNDSGASWHFLIVLGAENRAAVVGGVEIRQGHLADYAHARVLGGEPVERRAPRVLLMPGRDARSRQGARSGRSQDQGGESIQQEGRFHGLVVIYVGFCVNLMRKLHNPFPGESGR